MTQNTVNRTGGAGLGIAAILLAAGAGAWWSLRGNLAATRAELDGLNSTISALKDEVTLYRYEQRQKDGLGMDALLDQVRFWGPQYKNATTPAVERQTIGKHLDAIGAAMRSLGVDIAVPALVDAFIAEDSREGEDIREWMLRMLLEVDSVRAGEFLSQVVRCEDFPVTQRIRVLAARWLVRSDKERAAAVLVDILRTESYRGVQVDRIPAAQRAKYAKVATHVGSKTMFREMVPLYAATEHPDVENTLIMLLGRRHEHDFLTLQECIKALGSMKSTKSVKRIKELFAAPPRQSPPMFQNHCLDALVAIEGPAVNGFLREQLQAGPHELVRIKLQDLLKRQGS